MAADAGGLPQWATEYAWQYFLAHGQARMTTFRFYLVFCTILCAGFFSIVAASDRPIAAAPLGLILSFLSYTYWHVDLRHKELINNAHRALERLEAAWQLPSTDEGPNAVCLFMIDTLQKKEKKQRQQGALSYSRCVARVFLVFGVGGLALAVAACAW